MKKHPSSWWTLFEVLRCWTAVHWMRSGLKVSTSLPSFPTPREAKTLICALLLRHRELNMFSGGSIVLFLFGTVDASGSVYRSSLVHGSSLATHVFGESGCQHTIDITLKEVVFLADVRSQVVGLAFARPNMVGVSRTLGRCKEVSLVFYIHISTEKLPTKKLRNFAILPLLKRGALKSQVRHPSCSRDFDLETLPRASLARAYQQVVYKRLSNPFWGTVEVFESKFETSRVPLAGPWAQSKLDSSKSLGGPSFGHPQTDSLSKRGFWTFFETLMQHLLWLVQPRVTFLKNIEHHTQHIEILQAAQPTTVPETTPIALSVDYSSPLGYTTIWYMYILPFWFCYEIEVKWVLRYYYCRQNVRKWSLVIS